jgi:hypothetical protein
VPVATKACVANIGIEAIVGVTAIDTNVAGGTVKVAAQLAVAPPLAPIQLQDQ